MNAIEMNHTWKLHTEEDIGVPLAPTAMDPRLYNGKDESNIPKLHPDDEKLLNWKGSLGDSSKDVRKRKQEMARAAAIQVATGRSPARATIRPSSVNKKSSTSRVLKEDMPTWQKKTTYLANDHTRRVHDFRSLAETKQELVADLEQKKREIAARRSSNAIRRSFDMSQVVHPTKKNLKPVKVLPVLPRVADWGQSFTHVVIDKAPSSLPKGYAVSDLVKGLVTNVENVDGSQRMACDLQVPVQKKTEDAAAAAADTSTTMYRPLLSFDFHIEPLKEEDDPHASFCWLVGDEAVHYIPVPSRVKLATGRPADTDTPHPLERRPLTEAEVREMEERAAEVDVSLAAKYAKQTSKANDDGEDDYDDSDSDDDDDGGDMYPISKVKTVEAAN